MNSQRKRSCFESESTARHLRQLGSTFSITIPPDNKGYLGRECPECERYFKITPGTGITEGEPPCYCPYCGQCWAHKISSSRRDQIEYAKSVVLNKVTNAVLKDMKSLELNIKPRGPFGIGISAKVQGRPHRIRHYSEIRLEEEVVCDHCTLRYTVYGTFAYCPDCGRHNSRQILDKNLNLAEQQLALSIRLTVTSANNWSLMPWKTSFRHSTALAVKHAEFTPRRHLTLPKERTSGSRT